MANTKYEFTGETKEDFGVTLKRIRALTSFGAVAKGELGGWIEGEASLSTTGAAWVSGAARVFGEAQVFGEARVSGEALVSGAAWVFGEARVSGAARVSGEAQVFGEAQVSGEADLFAAGPLGSRRSTLTIHADAELGIRFTTGCFSGTEFQLKESIQKTHGDNEYARQYRAAIDLALMIVKAKAAA